MTKPKPKRQLQILAELDNAPSLRIAELARRLSVSTETIRRDLDELTEQGLLNRTYGGAVRPLSSEPSVTERHALFVEERQRIARAALSLVRDGRVIMIGSGSTTVHVARRIAVEMRNVTVITHSFGVATVLAINPTIRVLMMPGDYKASEGATVGVDAVTFLLNFHADFAILGASGLAEAGPSDALLDCGSVYSMMAQRSAETVVVADHSKFGKVFPACYAPWKQVGHVVTDAPPPSALAAAMRRSGADILVC
ncbi:MAG: DeoR/GlpR family DNA-binding transcription regulator [Shinella sp.]|nr:DeoR/GlpR family DNA-binding transcription regulator [Shinella sp.]